MRRFEALLFDLGSTLMYFDGSWPEVFTQSNAELIERLKSAGVSLDESTFLEEFRLRLEEYHSERESEFIEYTTAYILRTLLAEHGYANISGDTLRSVLRAMYAVSQERWLAEPDARSTLEKLRSEGYRMAIISNAADDEDVQTLVDKARLRPYFDFVLSSAAAGIRKPAPGIFQTVLERLGVEAQRAAMIGDTLGADVLGADNAGLFSIWITRRADAAANRAHLDTILPDAVISTLSELPDLLKNLQGSQIDNQEGGKHEQSV